MRKIIILFTSILLIGLFNVGNAELIQMSKEELTQESQKNEAIKNRKIYHKYNSTYQVKDADARILERLDIALEKIYKKNPAQLRRLYPFVAKKLETLGKQTRTQDGGITDKKHTRTYFLLEQINNKISDFEGNQDLGCQKGLAHMEGNICVDNTRNISNDSGSGYQKYDFINEKWNDVMMTNCNTGYSKATNVSGVIECTRGSSVTETIKSTSKLDKYFDPSDTSYLDKGYVCGEKQYCKNMDSCEEVKYYYYECGVKKFDRDGDGIPCENVCGNIYK